MKYTLLTIAASALLTITSCKQENTTTTPILEVATVNENLAKVETSWITERVTKAKKRLNNTEAGKIVWQSMEAHGGLQRFFENGPLSFRFDYVPLDGSTRRYTDETLDTWNNKAVHWKPEDTTQRFGWDGEKAWKQVSDSTAFPFDMRFWALTPYYLAGSPFILDGEGVNLEKLEDKTWKNNNYDVVKITFSKGTGDAPDDYYIIYVGKEDHKVAVVRYIVSYPKYFPNGGAAPEKLMEVQGTTIVNGIELPTGFHTHWLTEDEEAGEHITTITIDNIRFNPEIEKSYFDIPEGAIIIE